MQLIHSRLFPVLRRPLPRLFARHGPPQKHCEDEERGHLSKNVERIHADASQMLEKVPGFVPGVHPSLTCRAGRSSDGSLGLLREGWAMIASDAANTAAMAAVRSGKSTKLCVRITPDAIVAARAK